MIKAEDGLDWLAFRYIANEMSEVESSEFEMLLLDDQSAREAVAQAVEEATLLKRAFSDATVILARTQQSHWNHKSRRTAVVVLGSSLTLLLAWLVAWSSLSDSDKGLRQASEDDSTDLAYAWVEARSELFDPEQETDIELPEAIDGVLDSSLVAEEDELLIAPTWMLAALVKLNDDSDSNELIQELRD